MLKRTSDLSKDWSFIWNEKFKECENLLQENMAKQGVTRKYSHEYLVKSNSPILPGVVWLI